MLFPLNKPISQESQKALQRKKRGLVHMQNKAGKLGREGREGMEGNKREQKGTKGDKRGQKGDKRGTRGNKRGQKGIKGKGRHFHPLLSRGSTAFANGP